MATQNEDAITYETTKSGFGCTEAHCPFGNALMLSIGLASLDVVRVQKFWTRDAFENLSHFPCQVLNIMEARVHSSSTERIDQMGCITGEENSPMRKLFHQSLMEAIAAF